MSKKNPPNEMLEAFARLGFRIGTSAFRIHRSSEACVDDVEAREEADRRYGQFVNRVHRPLPNRARFGPRGTIGCMNLLLDELAHRPGGAVSPPLRGEKLLDFVDRVTMYAVLTDQHWGTAMDELAGGGAGP